MAKVVLGNDPFRRGAALRESTPPAAASDRAPKRRSTRSKGWKSRARAAAKPKSPAAVPLPVSAHADAGYTEPPRAREAAPQSTSQTSVQLLRGGYRAIRTALGLIDAPLDAYGEDPELVRDLSPIASFLFDTYWRVSVEGADNLPSGPSLLVANHAGALPLDGPMVKLAMARRRPDLPPARWLAEESVLRVPLMGVLLNRIGAVRATPGNALRLLEERKPLIVFPEGTHAGKAFQRRYELRPFGRGGFVKIALRARAPIVPVAIVGAREAMPVLATVPLESFGVPHLPLTLPPLPTKWVIRFGDPLEVELGEDDEVAGIARWTERVRTSVDQMLQEILSQRRSLFAG
jgi:1-acyl-sn-glycerol-3-phosphate acyltransferase